jgi:hypothetical protein
MIGSQIPLCVEIIEDEVRARSSARERERKRKGARESE